MHQERIYYRVIKKLLSDGLIAKNDRILVICAGRFDEEVLPTVAFYEKHPKHRFFRINGEQTIEQVHKEIVDVVSRQ